jgi:molecular chaperone GrpE (heat shock protein)
MLSGHKPIVAVDDLSKFQTADTYATFKSQTAAQVKERHDAAFDDRSRLHHVPSSTGNAFVNMTTRMIQMAHDNGWSEGNDNEYFYNTVVTTNRFYGCTNPFLTVRSLTEAELWFKSFLEMQVKPTMIFTLKAAGVALGALITITGIMGAAIGIYHLFNKGSEMKPQISYYQGEPMPGAKSKNYQRPKPKWIKVSQTAPHTGSSDPQADEVITNVLEHNIAEIVVHHQDGLDGILQALFLKGKDFISAAHLQSDLKHRICTGFTFKFGPDPKDHFNVDPSNIEMWVDEDNDRLFGRITDKTFPDRRDITNHIIRNNEVGDNLTLAVTLVSRLQGNKKERIAVNGRRRTDTIKYKTEHGDEYKCVTPYEWRIDCHEGNSGGTYVLRNPRTPYKICGIHTAGDKTHGLMAVLTYEDVAEFLGFAPNMKTNSKLVPDGCSPLSVVPKSFWHRIPDETEIKPTPPSIRCCIQEPIKAPAALKPVGENSPLFNAINSYSPSPYYAKAPYDERVRAAIIDLFKTEIIQPNPRNRPLTLIEALNTPMDMPNRTAVVIDTSCGWPANVRPGRGPGKSDYVKTKRECVELMSKGVDQEFYSHWIKKAEKYPHLQSDECKLPSPLLVNELHAYFGNIINGRDAKKEPLVYCDFLKDELRTLKKVAECNTRVVSAAPVVLVVAYRMMFSGYMEAQLSDPTHSYCSGGMNPISSDYHAFISNHADMSPSRNPVSFDLDGEKFDKNTTEWQGEDRVEIITGEKGYFSRSRPFSLDDFEEEFAYLFPRLKDILVAILWDCMSNRHLVVKGHIIEVPNRDPSGAPDTMEKNSMFNTEWQLGALASSMLDKLHYFDLRWIWKNIKLGTVGDDTQLTLSDELASWHTFARHVRFIRLWGLNATDAEKRKLHVEGDVTHVEEADGTLKPYSRRLLDTVFLKRRPHYFSGFYVGRLDLSTIGEIFNWYTSDNLPLELKSRLESAAKEWMLWGRDVYDTNMAIVNNAYEKAGYKSSCCYWPFSYVYTSTFHYVNRAPNAPSPYLPQMLNRVRSGAQETTQTNFQYFMMQPVDIVDPFLFTTVPPLEPPADEEPQTVPTDPRDLEPRDYKPQTKADMRRKKERAIADKKERSEIIRLDKYFLPWLCSHTSFPQTTWIVDAAIDHFSKREHYDYFVYMAEQLESMSEDDALETWAFDLAANQVVFYLDQENLGASHCSLHGNVLLEKYNLPRDLTIDCNMCCVDEPLSSEAERDTYARTHSFHSMQAVLTDEDEHWIHKPDSYHALHLLDSLYERYTIANWVGWETHNPDKYIDSFMMFSIEVRTVAAYDNEGNQFNPHMYAPQKHIVPPPVVNDNFKSACKEYHDKIGTPLPTLVAIQTGPSNAPAFICRLSHQPEDFGIGPFNQKSLAERELFRQYYESLQQQFRPAPQARTPPPIAEDQNGPIMSKERWDEMHQTKLLNRQLAETVSTLNDKLKYTKQEADHYREAYENLQKLKADIAHDSASLTAEISRLRKVVETQGVELNSFRNKSAADKLQLEHIESANWALSQENDYLRDLLRNLQSGCRHMLEAIEKERLENNPKETYHEFRPHMSSGLGNEERAPVLRTETNSATQLSSFIDQVAVASEPAPQKFTPVHSNANPYPSQGLKPVLSRLWQVRQLQWTSATPSGDLVAEFSFPKELLKIPTLYRYLTNFRYLQSAVKFQLRINSTPMHYGQLLVCYAPHFPEQNPTTPFKGTGWSKSIYYWSQFEVVEVSVNGQTTIEIEIPFISSESFFDLTSDSTTETEGYMGKVMIFCTAPLKTQTATGVASVDVTAWAALVDPEVTGFTYVPNHTAPTEIKRDFRPHMATREAEVRSEKGLVTNIAEAAVKLTDTAKSIPIIADVASVANPIAKAVASVANQLGLDKPTTVEVVHRMMLNSQGGFSNVKGLDSSERISADPESRNANDNVFCSRDYNQFQNYKLLPALIELGYFDSTYQINDEIWTSAVAPTKCAIESTTKVTYMTYLAELASHFRYWRGSIKFRIAFICSKFLSSRVVIEWIPNEFDHSLVDGTDSGNYQRMTVDINGDTVVTFCVPYLANTPYLVVPTPDLFTTTDYSQTRCFNGKLTIRIVNPPVTIDSTDQSQIYYTIWMAGGEDFQVDRPTGLWTNYHDLDAYPETPKYKPHMGTLSTIRDQFTTTFQSLSPAKMSMTDKLVNADHIGCWTEYMHRYQPHSSQNLTYNGTTNSFDVDISPWDPTTYLDTSWFRRFLKKFQFYRGSMRIKVIQNWLVPDTAKYFTYVYNKTTDSTNIAESFGFPFLESGVNVLQSDHRRIVETEMPFYGVMPLINMLYAREWVDIPLVGIRYQMCQPIAPDGLTIYVTIATGDDFSCGPPLPPNPLVLDVSSNNNTQTGRSTTKKLQSVDNFKL